MRKYDPFSMPINSFDSSTHDIKIDEASSHKATAPHDCIKPQKKTVFFQPRSLRYTKNFIHATSVELSGEPE